MTSSRLAALAALTWLAGCTAPDDAQMDAGSGGGDVSTSDDGSGMTGSDSMGADTSGSSAADTGGDGTDASSDTTDASSDSTTTTDGTGAGCEYPAGAVEPMAIDEVLWPYSWPEAIAADGTNVPLNLNEAFCDSDPNIEWSPHDVLVFISLPAW